MGLHKGQTNNPNGRPGGSKNKCTEEIRELIIDFLSNNFDKIRDDFSSLEPKERIKFYIQLLAYGVPRLQNENHSQIPNSEQIKKKWIYYFQNLRK